MLKINLFSTALKCENQFKIIALFLIQTDLDLSIEPQVHNLAHGSGQRIIMLIPQERGKPFGSNEAGFQLSVALFWDTLHSLLLAHFFTE